MLRTTPAPLCLGELDSRQSRAPYNKAREPVLSNYLGVAPYFDHAYPDSLDPAELTSTPLSSKPADTLSRIHSTL